MPKREKPKQISTQDYREHKDYQEAFNGEGDIYFGSVTMSPITDYFADIDKKADSSSYFEHVFYPNKRFDFIKLTSKISVVKTKIIAEQKDDWEEDVKFLNSLLKAIQEKIGTTPEKITPWLWFNSPIGMKFRRIGEKVGLPVEIEDIAESWAYEKNQAFWAGIIDKRRRLILVTDIAFYGCRKTGTMDELCWLRDNGYQFRPDPENESRTIVELPPSSTPKGIISDYKNGMESIVIAESLRKKVAKIKKIVLQLRESSKSADEDSGQPPEKSRRKGCSSEAASEAALKV